MASLENVERLKKLQAEIEKNKSARVDVLAECVKLQGQTAENLLSRLEKVEKQLKHLEGMFVDLEMQMHEL
ncbi:MAG TPA: hypothetical protein VJ327_03405 [Patescibacteria group bacterium]|nr:hypothetical protein [Patescibacteria group bacterium]